MVVAADVSKSVTDDAIHLTNKIVHQIRANNGELTPELRRSLAEKAFKKTSGYDRAIVDYLEDR